MFYFTFIYELLMNSLSPEVTGCPFSIWQGNPFLVLLPVIAQNPGIKAPHMLVSPEQRVCFLSISDKPSSF